MEQVYRDMCHACDSKLATHHISQPGSNPPSISLCGHCAETHVPSFAEDASPQPGRNSCCGYCGGVATGSPVFFAGWPGQEARPRFVCQSCSAEAGRHLLAMLAGRGLNLQELSDLIQLGQLGRIFEDLDAHMHRWVIQRDN